MPIRRHYWNPRADDPRFVDEIRYLYAFNKRQDAGTWSDYHVHSDWGELTWVSAGSIVMSTSFGNFLGQAWRAVWVPPGLQHEWYMLEACANRSLFIHPSALGAASRFTRYHAIELTPLLRELLLAVDDLKLDLRREEDERIGRVLIDRLKCSKEVGAPLLMPHERRLVELCAQALAAPDRPIRLEDWSRELGMSPKTLSRLFIRQTGQTFGRWLRGMRLQQAMSRIEEGRSVTAVALDCGYNSVSAFISAFKKQFGRTPGAVGKGRGADS